MSITNGECARLVWKFIKCLAVSAGALALFAMGVTRAAGAPQLLGQLEDSGGRFVSYSADGKRILTADKITARIWDAHSLKPLTPPINHGASIKSTMWIANDSRIATVGGNEVRIWDAGNGKLAGRIAQDMEVGPAAISPDGRWALTARGAQGAALWDTAAAKRVRLFEDPTLFWAGFSNDGTQLMTYSLKNPKYWGGFLHLREVKTGRDLIPPQTINCEGSSSSVAAVSPDGKRIVIGEAKRFSVYQIDGFKKISRQQGDGVLSLDAGYTDMVFFTPDGTRVIWVCDVCVQIFSADTGEPIRDAMNVMVVGREEIDVSHGNTFLLIGGLKKNAGVWDVASGKRLQTFGEKTSHCVALSPDGKFAAIGSRYRPKEEAGYTEIWKLDPDALPKSGK